MGEQEQETADITETQAEEGRPEPIETEGIGLDLEPPPDVGDDKAELKEAEA